MDKDIDKAVLLEEFKIYLESLDSDDNLAENAETHSVNQTDLQSQQNDLYSLFIEMSGLKNEVKTQARQFKSAIDDFRELFSTLRENQSRLEQQLKKKELLLETTKSSISRVFLLDLVGIRDSIKLSIEQLTLYSPTGLRKLLGNCSNFKNIVLEGQEIILKRIDRQLIKHKVRLIKTKQQNFNPHIMKVVDICHLPEQKNGQVMDEISPGYICNKKLLRLAEVKVNKHT